MYFVLKVEVDERCPSRGEKGEQQLPIEIRFLIRRRRDCTIHPGKGEKDITGGVYQNGKVSTVRVEKVNDFEKWKLTNAIIKTSCTSPASELVI